MCAEAGGWMCACMCVGVGGGGLGGEHFPRRRGRRRHRRHRCAAVGVSSEERESSDDESGGCWDRSAHDESVCVQLGRAIEHLCVSVRGALGSAFGLAASRVRNNGKSTLPVFSSRRQSLAKSRTRLLQN